MHRSILTCVFMAAVCAALSAQQSPQPDQSQQQSSSSDTYQGVSHPPSDSTIMANEPANPPQPSPPPAKPRAGKPLVQSALAQPAQTAPVAPSSQAAPSQPASADLAVTGNDDGIVSVAPPAAVPQPSLTAREAPDPDGDIVHPDALAPGELPSGTMIRVHLLTRLSTADSHRGDEFRARVASDVLQDGQVLIPAGSEIDGRVVEVSSGSPGGHGTMRLRPDWVVLPNGSNYRLDAQVTETPGSNDHVGSEGVIAGGSRYKKDGIEYGGGVGAGVVTGALVGGPVGALAGGIIGGSAITVHLLINHPQATLEPGAVLIFSLNSRLDLQPPTTAGN
jgi:Bacterial conjugation TrbI-like protein